MVREVSTMPQVQESCCGHGHGGEALLDARSSVLAEIWIKPGVLGPMMNGAEQNQG